MCAKQKDDEKEIPLLVISDRGSEIEKKFVGIEKSKWKGQNGQRGEEEEKNKLTIYSQQFEVKYLQKSQDRFGLF